MKGIFLIILLFLGTTASFACCVSGSVTIYPRGNIISENPIFLIEYSERDYHIFEKIEEIGFYIEYDNGEEVKLLVSSSNSAASVNSQFVLSPISELNISDNNFSIKVRGTTISKNFQKFLSYRKFSVKLKKDTIPPNFSSPIKGTYANYLNSSASGHSVNFSTSYDDNYEFLFQRSNRKMSELLVELSDEKGNTYLIAITNSTFGIYQGMCGSYFLFSINTNLKFYIQLVDFSGNKSEAIREIEFKIVENKFIMLANR